VNKYTGLSPEPLEESWGAKTHASDRNNLSSSWRTNCNDLATPTPNTTTTTTTTIIIIIIIIIIGCS